MLGNGQGVNSLLNLLRRDSYELQPNDRDAALLDTIGRMHTRPLRKAERSFYRDHLAWGGSNDSTQGRQRVLAEVLAGINANEFGFAQFHEVQRTVRNDALSVSLAKIGRLERLIAPAAQLFAFLQDRDGQTVSSVAGQIRDTWRRPLRLDLAGIGELLPTIAEALRSQQEAKLWNDLVEALSDAQYVRVIDNLVAINTSVMQRRHNGAAWIAIESGKIQVRLADERAELLPVRETEDLWKSTYFINSLWRVSREVSA